jgi:hypothetical protein
MEEICLSFRKLEHPARLAQVLRVSTMQLQIPFIVLCESILTFNEGFPPDATQSVQMLGS